MTKSKISIHKPSFRWLVLLALLCVGTTVSAQKTIVYGTVYDAESKDPLPFVNVAFKDTKIGTTTSIDGTYRLETYYSSDSLLASFVGYKPQAIFVKKDVSQEINFNLDPGSVSLGEFVVNAKDFEDPAHILLKRIIKNKPINNREKLDAYQYETYNKIQFDLNNMSEKFTQRKLFNDFDFIFAQIDSTNEKVSLPFFITETLSDYYYERQPKGRKEIIRATKVSGINNESVSQFLGQMYLDVNVYDNSIPIFGKNFVSPISNYGLIFYEYHLVDSMFIDSKWCYRMDFVPKNQNDLVFNGHMWVNDTTYAVKEIDARILKSANINFITDLKVHHNYDEVAPEVWMLTKEDILADFTIVDSKTGFYGKKLTTYRDFVINEPKDHSFYGGAEPVVVETAVNEKPETYWMEARHETISDDQQGIYDMVDSLKTVPIFMTYVDVVNFVFQGYKVKGPIEIGPVFTFLSYNFVEGLRPKFGLRTSNEFSTDLMLEGYVAYGTKDHRFKYMLGGKYFLSKNPRQFVGAYYSEDLELIGQVPNYFSRDNVVTVFTVRNRQDRLILNKQFKMFVEREWFTGFSTRLEFRRRDLAARGDWKFEKDEDVDGYVRIVDLGNIISSEVSIEARFAFRESFVSGEFERISLGSIWPIINVRADFGISGLLGGQYDYQKLTATLTDKLPLGPFGTLRYGFELGKTWNSMPYPLQFVHAGNESFLYNDRAFNTMNFFEFVSDEYFSIRAEHHFEGLFLNKIPLFQKLKWRELIGVNMIYGSFSENNREEMLLPIGTNPLGARPFAETYVGIENIFKFFRIDAIWRMTYRELPNTHNFGVLLGFDIQF